MQSSLEQVFSTHELLEHILSSLFDGTSSLWSDGTWRNDWRTIRSNAAIIKQVLLVSRVNRQFRTLVITSPKIQKQLYLKPDENSPRSWTRSPAHNLPSELSCYYRATSEPSGPELNPVIQAMSPALPLRFWNLTGDKYCAFLIFSRDDVSGYISRHSNTSFSRMLLSQPPCKRLFCEVFEDRDPSRDYVGKTNDLSKPYLSNETGLTIAMVFDRMVDMFEKHQDIAGIKLVTI